ncbi:bifunctional folylpolyglutamate synthase/dihydrofolate synthase [Rhodoblastus acidophilus]|uniref:Dihydrofolate synthase/folylpolyglutamate synthase n=1 Tax=Candidatus Rhodoblastus alkanivorans TaxID=2954117 RepID=A0ABS9Z2R6_9HYPH|nr:folylpolyglutamate synthase/dihydrofolate synthase family protein [Candidatus Rhodoblastus alkanivorans]MCI4678054.1 bifunctional folylpolyglutamate synthase/dihydrofolate synthase [Candidatus Rhodoblastus alkanivorans]MCI4681605.1 bifunctional folylpolyglutamate synthase/dihydrofolate synthase [Candidatus Rhodoblastus alkanivorans]MDI4642653.1 bifunctional folylpolyglutamate synthase/dihydrofolate synthase [Rhodoblastus acidophilus]
MTTPDALQARLLDLHPKRIDLSLGRIRRLLAALGDPQKRLPPTIHVAGTNGKGSTIAFMRAILEAAGFGVHVYTSPHLVDFRERIRLAAPGGGKLASDPELAEALAAIEKANAGAPITFFEATTAAALKMFAERPADALLLEVGLGGRFDATNVIETPACAVIAPISIDHVEFLGDTLEKIAFEKAGIIKPGAPVVVSAQADEALVVVERQAARLRAPFVLYGQDFLCRAERGRLVYEDALGLLDLPLPRLPGRHQVVNAGTAIAALRQCWPNLSFASFERGVVTAHWPGRLQNIGRGQLAALAPEGAELWLDGGHNQAGGRALAEAMADFEEKSPRPLILLYGGLRSKDAGAFLRHFVGLAAEVHALPVRGDQVGRAPEEVAATAEGLGLKAQAWPAVEEALRALAGRAWPSPPRILIAGSLYLVGEVLAINGTPPE